MSTKALQLIQSKEGEPMTLKKSDLVKILMTNEIKDRFVCVISIAGAFRKGKSFMLNFFLRYLYVKYVQKDVSEFLGSENDPLSGFSWRHGTERETTGILMWSDIFLHDFQNGDKVAIILLDTQGSFDHQSTVRDCASIFALSTMISSVQIYNISQLIQENDLQHLELFVNYGKIATENSSLKPFQRLIFLIRDWSYGKEYPFGGVGGNKYLENILKVKTTQQKELQELRNNINSCFMELACFLLPHPGLVVSCDSDYNGNLNDIEQKFLETLPELLHALFLPENLIIKEINGQKIRAKDWIEYLNKYTEVFNSDTLPEPKSVFLATAEIHNITISSEAKCAYTSKMAVYCGVGKPCLTEKALESFHLTVMDEIFSEYESKPKIGGQEMIAQYRNEIVVNINDQYENLKSLNQKKLMEVISKLTTCVEDAKCLYINDMKSACKEYVTHLSDINTKFRNKALGKFDMDSQCHIDTLGNTYRDKLIQILNGEYLNFEQLNNGLKMKLENNNLNAVSIAKDMYNQSMEKACKSHVKDILLKHNEFKKIALSKYNEYRDCGDEQFKKQYYDLLENFFESRYKLFETLNKSKYEHILNTVEKDKKQSLLSYINSMNVICNTPHLSEEVLLENHNSKKNFYLKEFESIWTDSYYELCKEHSEKLRVSISVEFEEIKSAYEKRNGGVISGVGRVVGLAGKIGGSVIGAAGGLIVGTPMGLASGAVTGFSKGAVKAFEASTDTFGNGFWGSTIGALASGVVGLSSAAVGAVVGTGTGAATGTLSGYKNGYKAVDNLTNEGDLVQNVGGSLFGSVVSVYEGIKTGICDGVASSNNVVTGLMDDTECNDVQKSFEEFDTTVGNGAVKDVNKICKDLFN